MPWAVDFLPPHIMLLTNFVTSVEPYTGSGATSRFAIKPLRGILLFFFLQLGDFSRAGPGERFSVAGYRFSAIGPHRGPATENLQPKSLLRCCLRTLRAVLRAALLAVGD